MARAGLRRDTRRHGDARARESDGVLRVRSDSVEPARRPPHADDGARASSAAGHSPIALVGGGTGLIGDPSGKTAERTLQSPEAIEANVRGIRAQLEGFSISMRRSNAARLVDNGEWLNSMTAMEFLRDVGKYFTVNYLLAKESVKRRIESEDGISYTEFSYSLLQAYDFLVLHDRFNCRLQIGGSDQWGNIVAGTDLIRKLRGAHAHGLVIAAAA